MNSQLYNACKNNDLVEIKKFKKSELTMFDNTAIQVAAFFDNFDILKYLVEQGCDHSISNNWCIKNGGKIIVKYLLEQGCDSIDVNDEIKYDVIWDFKVRLLFFLNDRLQKQNLYLKMEIIILALNYYTEWEIMSLLKMCNK